MKLALANALFMLVKEVSTFNKDQIWSLLARFPLQYSSVTQIRLQRLGHLHSVPNIVSNLYVMVYCLSKEQLPILYRKLQYKLGNYSLDIWYIKLDTLYGTHIKVITGIFMELFIIFQEPQSKQFILSVQKVVTHFIQ